MVGEREAEVVQPLRLWRGLFESAIDDACSKVFSVVDLKIVRL